MCCFILSVFIIYKLVQILRISNTVLFEINLFTKFFFIFFQPDNHTLEFSTSPLKAFLTEAVRNRWAACASSQSLLKSDLQTDYWLTAEV